MIYFKLKCAKRNHFNFVQKKHETKTNLKQSFGYLMKI